MDFILHTQLHLIQSTLYWIILFRCLFNLLLLVSGLMSVWFYSLSFIFHFCNYWSNCISLNVIFHQFFWSFYSEESLFLLNLRKPSTISFITLSYQIFPSLLHLYYTNHRSFPFFPKYFTLYFLFFIPNSW
jgi:hypothetical protein